MKKIISNIKNNLIIISKKIDKITLSELDFLNEAIDSVLLSRIILMNSSFIAYYLYGDKENSSFVYNQENLEKLTDDLQLCIEKESINEIITEDNLEFEKKLYEYKIKIDNLTQENKILQEVMINFVKSSEIKPILNLKIKEDEDRI